MKSERTNIFALLLGLTLAWTASPVCAQFSYVTNNGTITITRYTGSGGNVSIPSTINGLPVTTIWWAAFRWIGMTSSQYRIKSLNSRRESRTG